MKNSLLLTASLFLFLLIGCTTSTNVKDLQSSDLTGLWTLFKEEKQGKTNDYSGVPSATRIEFIENGYFLMFDQITDKKINSTSFGSIQDKLKGQFEVVDGTIQLNHYIGDSLVKRQLSIVSMEKDVLVLQDDKGKTSHFKRQ
jgi:hypothetical protein